MTGHGLEALADARELLDAAHERLGIVLSETLTDTPTAEDLTLMRESIDRMIEQIEVIEAVERRADDEASS